MAIFVDTSALYSVLAIADERHADASDQWAALLAGDEPLINSNYVLVESLALLANRLGFQAARVFQTEVVPVLQTVWVDEAVHQQAIAAFLTAGRRDLSLVDCVSFAVMRRLGLDTAFAFDPHFVQQGFHCVP